MDAWARNKNILAMLLFEAVKLSELPVTESVELLPERVSDDLYTQPIVTVPVSQLVITSKVLLLNDTTPPSETSRPAENDISCT